MVVTITFRLNEEDNEHEVALDDLKAQIASGEIGPKTLVRDRVLTGGEWWTLDNLNFFHIHSPIHHDVGSYLQKKNQMQEEKRYAKQVKSDWSQKVFASIPSNFVSDSLGFESFEKILDDSESKGVTRLIRHSAFGGIDGVTIIFRQSEVSVSTASSVNNPNHQLTAPVLERINSEIPNWDLLARKFAAEEVTKKDKRLPLQSLFPPLNNWADTKTAVNLAPNCTIPTLDGYSFFHSAAEIGWYASSTWCNPRQDLTPVQAKLVEAYKPFLTCLL
jgi:hypothetical protein